VPPSGGVSEAALPLSARCNSGRQCMCGAAVPRHACLHNQNAFAKIP
jgi:hypothetical protein